ncbi:MAG: hypothetical protein KAW12_16855 [Candidatus Aminicenantes bacterium]|nr:hypothetical protein [Candidatus Aminicenantes bacterium]
MKREENLDFISKIIDKSGKEISEAVLVFLSAVKYISKEGDVFAKLEETDSFQEYIEDNSGLIMKLSIEKSVQGNIPERGLPILEILSRKIGNTLINVIELGASYGLIGRCLLDPINIIKNKDRYFPARQKIPENIRAINKYLGIELNPPDKDWLLAGIWEEDIELRLRNFINDIQPGNEFELTQGNAFGFTTSEPVKKLVSQPGTVIVLTSFMLYQYSEKKRKILKDNILEFTKRLDGHWINQAVNVATQSQIDDYYIAWDDKKIIELNDDTCMNWRWLSESD